MTTAPAPPAPGPGFIEARTLLGIELRGPQRRNPAHADPGVPNWLDPGGHAHGSLALRYFGITTGFGAEPRWPQADSAGTGDPAGKASVVTSAMTSSALASRNGAVSD